MSVFARRAVVGRALHDVMLSPDFRRWMDSWGASARDDDGDVVALTFADDEPAEVLISESAPHRHAVIMTTLHRQAVAAWVLGPLPASGTRPDNASGVEGARVVAVSENMTVGDVVDQLMALAQQAYGARFVLEFTGSRRLFADLAPA